jgi:GGDEF domain-containing protein
MKEANIIEKYELINGMAVIDSNLQVITANENFYKFVGISRCYTLMDVIHQVDMDDFMEVGNSLRVGQKKTMVIRMRRVDNSYRWVLTDVIKGELVNADKEKDDYEYIELHMNDVQGLQHQYQYTRQLVDDYSMLLAMEGELVFSMDYKTREVEVYRFIDKKMTLLETKLMSDLVDEYLNNSLIVSEDVPVFKSMVDDINKGVPEFNYRFSIKTTEVQVLESGRIEVKGNIHYDNYNRPHRMLGTLRRLDDMQGYSRELLTHDMNSRRFTKDEVLTYVRQNIEYNAAGEVVLMLLQIDGLDELRREYGDEAANKLHSFVHDMCRDAVGYRGVVGADEDGTIYASIAANGITLEVNTRAFIESLRNMIKWRYREKSYGNQITFSIGVSRYPFNGKDYNKMVEKAYRALGLAISKGRKRYILYKEAIHGEM